MRISDWSSDVCSSDLLTGADAANHSENHEDQTNVQSRYRNHARNHCENDAEHGGQTRQLFHISPSYFCLMGRAHDGGIMLHRQDFMLRGKILKFNCISDFSRGLVNRENVKGGIPGRVRSEERRGGKEGVSTCRSRWSTYDKKKKQ